MNTTTDNTSVHLISFLMCVLSVLHCLGCREKDASKDTPVAQSPKIYREVVFRQTPGAYPYAVVLADPLPADKLPILFKQVLSQLWKLPYAKEETERLMVLIYFREDLYRTRALQGEPQGYHYKIQAFAPTFEPEVIGAPAQTREEVKGTDVSP